MKAQNSRLAMQGFVKAGLGKCGGLVVAAGLAAVLGVAGWGLIGGVPARAQTPGRAGGGDSSPRESLEIPVGTILPVKINRGFSSKNAKSGQTVTARVMQDVPLPGGGKIPAGTKAIGTVVSATPAGRGSGGARVSLRFDQLEVHHLKVHGGNIQGRIPIVADLRALASFAEVDEAEVPDPPLDYGTSDVWATMRLIGGDMKYGVAGPVTDQNSRTIGEGVYDGVLVHVRAKPESKCRGALDAEDRLQALWVFSGDACGVYGMRGTTILHAGRTEPFGEIVLAAESGEVKVRSGSGALLRVIR